MSCPACLTGSLDEGPTHGAEESVELASGSSTRCYVSRPAAGAANGRAIILGTDVFGWQLVNIRRIADAFAAAGYHSFVPDYLGDPIPLSLLETFETAGASTGLLVRVLGTARLLWTFITVLKPWMRRHPTERAAQLVSELAQHLRQQQQQLKQVFYSGYCYGGSVGFLVAAAPRCLDGIAIAHPGPTKDAEIAAIDTPFLVCAAEQDAMLPPKVVAHVTQVLADKQREQGLQGKVRVFPGTRHGFATRARRDDSAAQAARRDALQEVMAFFEGVVAVAGAAGA